MDDYRKYLAQQILTEDKLVTYRLLSRALKVHVNTAKEMLYEFHKWQNDKRPDTLHATYLVYGTRKKQVEANGDVEMTDSQSENETDVSSNTMTLVREEKLQEALQQYEEVTSIHVYSLAPHPLKDLQLLVDTAQTVARMTLEEDSTGSGNVYGMIANPGVRKRERKGGMPKAAPAVPIVKAEPKAQVKQESQPAVKEEPKTLKTAPTKEMKGPVATAAKKAAAAPALKRQGSSGGIGQMFAKAAAKPKKPAPRTTSNTPSVIDTPSPALSDEGEDDSEMPDVKPDPVAAQARKSRQNELRKMMEESDEEIEPKAETPAEEPEEEEMEEIPAEPAPKADEGPSEVVSSTGNGRKRGKRRVSKKVTKMDDQGYLITSQELAWESFSEDEAPPPLKTKVEKTEKPAPAAKGKKGGAKGQGSIMSFFAKK
ncbi:hypothetical protein PFICI_12787 [Pestalotiopsis fici W106-1]|uniref:DNA polymerase delta subunit 3 n=1 Tax=Pestalotiopsis fici (strain W106-1 / CGMCC3.15140) TaxID=1229662 RepID=W3WPQ8_PESFW|nr:uncharacterized protein PFICI_12787 [Pestalotiopsis fici W106-1]ETS75843.1 hypothetical protein PFICI_12787 [Pestalotiopsis fici W106-1]